MRVLGGMALVLLLSACGPKTMDARLRDAEKLADRASNHLDRAEKAAAALEPRDMESALDDAKRTLAEKDIELYPEAQMHLDRYQELAGRLPQVKAAREKRDLDLRLNAARDKIVPRVQAMMDAQEALVPTAPTRALVDTAENKAKAVKEAVDENLDLFVKDADSATRSTRRSRASRARARASRSSRGRSLRGRKDWRCRRTRRTRRNSRTRSRRCGSRARGSVRVIALPGPSTRTRSPAPSRSSCRRGSRRRPSSCR